MDFNKQKVLVLGLGLSGRAVARYFLDQNIDVVGLDKSNSLLDNPEVKELLDLGLNILPDQLPILFNSFDCLIVSPGISNKHPIIQSAEQEGFPILGEIELACQLLTNPMIAITGTNGKTTVTLLTEHVLSACGLKAKAVGNVGVPLISEVVDIDPETILVVELSSYQIERLSNPVFESAVLLNITPDHLDRYGSMEHYAQAKCNLKKSLKQHKPFFIEEKTYQDYSDLLIGSNNVTYGIGRNHPIGTDLKEVFLQGNPVFELPEILKGRPSHDVENLLASFALCSQFDIKGKDFLKAFHTFEKPPHRIEFVRDLNGIRFINDSKGTNLDAVMRAVESVEGVVILIAGGVDKGAAYTPWIQSFNQKVKSICAIGQAAEKLHCDLSKSIPVTLYKTLREAVEGAYHQAFRGDTILLSPGCSSYDMFTDYAHRGCEFQSIVKSLSSKNDLVKDTKNND